MATSTSSSPSMTERPPRRTRVAVVETAGRDKTIKVRIDRLVRHPMYGKYRRRRSVLHVHDERNEAKVGDVVEIMECRPLSRTKNWRLVSIVRSGPAK
jgi:small subunit ribosomal protein S17